MICHICESETEFTCNECGEPVCEDCCVVPTYHNQIDYALCTDCQDIREAADYAERSQEWEAQEQRARKKEAQCVARRAKYYLPENIKKKRLAKLERHRLKQEANRNRLKELANILSGFRGMF